LDLSIIIVNFNSSDLTGNCIRSIYRYLGNPAGNNTDTSNKGKITEKKLSWEIIITDNGSKDGSIEFIRGKISEIKDGAIHLIELGKNTGFAKAANKAADIARGRYLLFMNPDCELIGEGLEKIADFYEVKNAASKAGALGVRILNSDGSIQYSCRAFPRLKFQLYDALFLAGLFRRSRKYGAYFMTWWDHLHTLEVDWVSGAFLFISNEAFKDAGRFSEQYFMYSEDTELCLELKKKGYTNYYYADYVVRHLDGAVASRNMALREAQVWKSRKIYFAKNHGWFHGQLLSFLYFKYTVNRLIAYSLLWFLNYKGRKQLYKKHALICSNAIRLYFSGI